MNLNKKELLAIKIKILEDSNTYLIQKSYLTSLKKKLNNDDLLTISKNLLKKIIKGLKNNSDIYTILENYFLIIYISEEKIKQENIEMIFNFTKKQNLLDSFIKIMNQHNFFNCFKQNELILLFLDILSKVGIKIHKLSVKQSELSISLVESKNKIDSYLFSYLNKNDNSTRLILISYFCQTFDKNKKSYYLDTIIRRFGYTILIQVLEKFFQNKARVDSYLYLKDHISIIMNTNFNSNQLLNKVFRIFLFKEPSKFLFLWRLLADEFFKNPNNKHTYSLFLHHSVSLLQLMSNTFHEKYLKELISIIYIFHKTKEKKQIINQLVKNTNTQKNIKDLLYKIEYFYYLGDEKSISTEFHLTRKGRKHNQFSNNENNTVQQIIALGSIIKITV